MEGWNGAQENAVRHRRPFTPDNPLTGRRGACPLTTGVLFSDRAALHAPGTSLGAARIRRGRPMCLPLPLPWPGADEGTRGHRSAQRVVQTHSTPPYGVHCVRPLRGGGVGLNDPLCAPVTPCPLVRPWSGKGQRQAHRSTPTDTRRAKWGSGCMQCGPIGKQHACG